MLKLRSIAARLILTISLTVAAACGILGTFSILQQRSLTQLALDQQLKLDYDSVVAAIDYEEEIAGQVTAIQSATSECATAIGGISQTIRDISGIAASIAAAVEEQDSATREIARSVQQAATGTGEVTQNVAGASQAADRSRALADGVMTASGQLSRQATALFESVDTFLAGLRNAA
jgi:methyl-accepting chemotaxis protein